MDNQSNDTTLFVPALGGVYRALEPLTVPMIRVTAGAMLIPHGWGKIIDGGVNGFAGYLGKLLGIEQALALAYYVGLVELVGGAMLMLGLLTRVVAAQVVGLMAVAAFAVHWGNGFLWNKGGFEYPLFWGIVALAFVIRGGGGYSLDAKIGREF